MSLTVPLRVSHAPGHDIRRGAVKDSDMVLLGGCACIGTQLLQFVENLLRDG